MERENDPGQKMCIRDRRQPRKNTGAATDQDNALSGISMLEEDKRTDIVRLLKDNIKPSQA